MSDLDIDKGNRLDLSIVIVSYNTKDMLRDCLAALPQAVYPLECETFVVDNNSPDDSAGMVAEEFPQVRLICNNGNAGFTRANNQALAQCVGRNVVILNPDTEARPGSLTTLVRFLDDHPDVGAVGPKLLNTDGTLQPSGTPFPTAWSEFVGHSGLFKKSRRFHGLVWSYGREQFDTDWETDSVSGACLMVRHDVMDKVGMLSEDFFMYYEEVEWCWRIKRAPLTKSMRSAHFWHALAFGSTGGNRRGSNSRTRLRQPVYCSGIRI